MAEAALPHGAHLRAGSLRLLPDDRLARSAAKGETRAFAAIFQRYHQELYRYCRAVLRDEEDAQDALQNTMIRALSALPGEEREMALRPWLYRVAHNEAVSILRRRPPAADPDVELAVPGPEQQAETRERLRGLVGDLEALPERQRSALVMRELSGIDYEEIGAALGAGSAGAKQIVYEARIALKEMAEGRETACGDVQRALSDGDGRVLRGRKLRSHLRGCQACQDFRGGIRQRRADMAVLAPPIPAAVAAGVLHAVVGGGGGGGGGGLLGLLAGGGGKAVATSAAAKSAAAVVATATIAVGTADLTGVIDTPVVGGGGAQSESTATGPGAQVAAKAAAVGSAAGLALEAGKSGAANSKHAAGKKSHRAGDGRSPGRHGARGRAHSGTIYGQQVAASHRPTSLPAQALNHPTPTSHPGAGKANAPGQAVKATRGSRVYRPHPGRGRGPNYLYGTPGNP